MANDCFYFKNLDIIGMLDDMESDFVKDLENLIKKYGVYLFTNTKKRTPVDTGQLRRSWQLKYKKGDLSIRLYNNTEYGLNI